ncbi:MAG: M50 family metallopeptidase [Candidatus Micrarchaeota archaeon]|nr:M50 family metallopeptidase [Candidatus Micrarchaeota archaeon]
MCAETTTKAAFALASVVAALVAFLLVIQSPLSATVKFLASVIILSICGLIIATAYGLEGWGGLFLLRSKWGLREIEHLSKHKLWQTVAEIGMVIGYGSFAHFLMGKKEANLKHFLTVYGIGTVLLVTISTFIAPLAIAALLSMLSGGEEFSTAKTRMSQTVEQFEYSRQLFFILLILGGIALLTTVSIVVYGINVGWSIISALLGDHAHLAATAPGGTPIIPGINLPFFEGIAALVVVLVVHEGMHGILAARHRMPIKSAGVAMFGFLPVGAFVDVDEKKLFKEKKESQNSVLVAGVAGNFLASVAFLGVFFIAHLATDPFRISGIYVEKSDGVIPAGAVVQEINGKPVATLLGMKLKPETVYTIKTSHGVFKKKTDSKGSLGITYVRADKKGIEGAIRYAPSFEWIASVLKFLLLAFALNFVIAAMNLVPIPLFDGYHIMRTAIRDKLVQNAIVFIVIAAFLLNLFPWVLR